MRRRQFHSELTCDEVWYRMNVLLQSFAIWGAKRYRVCGELTEWGCYLSLRDPEGPGGTPAPMRLWTEDAQGPGCEIVCFFLPPGREMLGIALAGAGFCLEFFLAGLASGASLFQALLTGLWAGCAAAAVVYFLFFELVRLVSRKREKELLQWIQTYLLLRELDGVLLPDLEAQKAEWAGLPPEEKPVKKRRFAFRSALPPEELYAALETWASQENLRCEGREIQWSVERQGSRIKIFRTETAESRRKGTQAGGGSVEYSSGRYKSWQWADPFCGTVEPDGRGGSVLRGGFSPHLLSQAVPAAVLFVLCCALCVCFPLRLALPLCLIAAVLCAIPARKNPLNNPGSHAILNFLQTYLEEK